MLREKFFKLETFEILMTTKSRAGFGNSLISPRWLGYFMPSGTLIISVSVTA